MSVKISDLLLLKAMGELRYEPVPRRVRGYADGVLVIDSLRAVLLWEPSRVVPTYAVPAEDVLTELVPAPARAEPPPSHPIPIRPDLTIYDPSTPFAFHTAAGAELTVRSAGRDHVGAAYGLYDPELAGYAAVDFDAFTWTEEDDPVVGHPRDPFSRIELRASSRSVRIVHDGQLLAETTRSIMLFESTHVLPVRYYLPREDVRVELVPTDLRSYCPYKGQAGYWTARLADGELPDIAWSYAEPLPEVAAVRDRISFFTERLDVLVDGVPLPRPASPWSADG